MKKIFKNKKVIISLLIVICLVGGGIFGYNYLKPEKKAQRAVEKYFSQLKKDKIPKETDVQDLSTLKKTKIIDYKCYEITNHGNSTERQLFYNFIVEKGLEGRKSMKIIAIADKKSFSTYKVTMIVDDTRPIANCP
ncbi:hypothetical protein [Clostridium sp. KNHs214]|uniref:hypothetical protein n=1 Tax=Clostridium sp. KNHs214 TaxID=1540257 RepID=UPI00054DC0ED|nr:hypothetical protein [Clostridium sp. KNHs214]